MRPCFKALIITVSAAWVLAACTLPPAKTTIENLNRRFVGLHTNEFFLHYGDAARISDTAGEKTYDWISTCQHLVTDTNPCSLDQPYCEVEIHPNGQGIIQQIVMTHDEMGERSASTCTEAFHGWSIQN